MTTIRHDPDADPAHERVRSALAETGSGLAPRPGWEDAVWARIDGGGRRRWGWLAGGAALAAAAIVLVVWAPWRDRAAGRDDRLGDRVAMVEPTIEIRKGAQVMRGTSAAPGDSAVVRHASAGALVWVFRGETLQLACDAGHAAPPGCRRDGAGVVVDVVLDRPGTYHVLTAAGALAAPATLDAALAALTTGGVRFRHDELDVR